MDFRAKVVKKVTRVLPALLPLGCGRKKEKVFAHHLQGCKKLLFYDPCVEQALADGGRFVARNGVKKTRLQFCKPYSTSIFFIFYMKVEEKKGTKVAKLGRTSYPNEAPLVFSDEHAFPFYFYRMTKVKTFCSLLLLNFGCV